jgi:LmbE family N-acetylglucosaminyl deacetylase
MNKQILVVAAHSDDEVLGCAGTIVRHTNAGDKVHLLFMTDGVGSRLGVNISVNSRILAAENSAKILGVTSVENLDFPDNSLDGLPLLDIIKVIEAKIEKLQPQVIYTHHLGDLNVDHQITHKAVMTACRPQPDFCVKEIFAFEVLSSTEWQTPGYFPFIPNVFVDIGKYIDIKRKALEVYSEEMRQSPHSRSIENTLRLNALRGNAVGVEYAESFVLLRKIK